MPSARSVTSKTMLSMSALPLFSTVNVSIAVTPWSTVLSRIPVKIIDSAGPTVTFNVKLSVEPSADVTVTVPVYMPSSCPPGIVTLTPTFAKPPETRVSGAPEKTIPVDGIVYVPNMRSVET